MNLTSQQNYPHQQYNPLPKLKFLTTPPPPAKTYPRAYSQSSIKTNSLKTKPYPAGLSPRIICQVSLFFPKNFPKLLHQPGVDCSPFPGIFMGNLGMGKNPTQQTKIYSFPPSEKSPLIDWNLSPSKVSFLPHQTEIFK